MHENKGMHDEMPDEMSGNCAQLMPFLQKNSRFEGLNCLNCHLGSGLVVKSHPYVLTTLSKH